jgi:hypothetical protein
MTLFFFSLGGGGLRVDYLYESTNQKKRGGGYINTVN